jgi:predicted small secreted protein
MNASFKRLILFLGIISVLAMTGVGCGTAHGFGKDMEKAGEKIQDGTN